MDGLQEYILVAHCTPAHNNTFTVDHMRGTKTQVTISRSYMCNNNLSSYFHILTLCFIRSTFKLLFIKFAHTYN